MLIVDRTLLNIYTMWDLLRESSVGQLFRFFNKSQSFPYPEEYSSYQLPEHLCFSFSDIKEEARLCNYQHHRVCTTIREVSETESDDDLEACRPQAIPLPPPPTRKPSLKRDITTSSSNQSWLTTALTKQDGTMCDVESIRKPSVRLVDWESDHDPANPQNWSFGMKLGVTVQIGLYTFAVYIGSSLYAPSQDEVAKVFGTNHTVSTLGIALYVIGYGVGPLLFSPLSEIPRIGRTVTYIITFFIFVLLALAASVVNNLAGLLTLRFLLGFFGSPCLATAGATLDDMVAPWKLAYVLTTWSFAATLGPALGPIISGFAVSKMGWRWSQWELFWLAAPIWLIMFLFMPETNPDTILHRKAARLRLRTGRSDLMCEADMKRRHMTKQEIVIDALIKPWEINILDPGVLYTTLYSAVLYLTYYSFFEAFPLVYIEGYGWGLGEAGLPFMAFVPGLALAAPAYLTWFRLKVEPVMRKKSPPLYGDPESRLLPAVLSTFLGPTGLFIFAFTAQRDTHWILNIVGLVLFIVCVFMAFQCMFFYIARCYPKYSASLFAANDFARSLFAAASILFSPQMYATLGVKGGVSLMGGLAVLCSGGMIVLYYFGGKMRVRSRFAQ